MNPKQISHSSLATANTDTLRQILLDSTDQRFLSIRKVLDSKYEVDK